MPTYVLLSDRPPTKQILLGTMKRSGSFLLLLIAATGAIHAQRQYWFVTYGGATSADPLFYGGIVRVDSNALNPEVVYSFDPLELNGLASGSALVQASNGRLYGMSNAADSIPPYTGQLFWIDPATDSVHIAVQFGTAQYPEFAQPQPRSSLLEIQPGLLIGHTSGWINPGTIFKYFTANDSIVRILTLPNSVCQAGSAPVSIQGTLFKASDGYLYGYSPPNVCKSESLVRISPTLTGVSYHNLNTSYLQGFLLNGDGILEHNDTLVFTTFRGGPGDGGFNGQSGRGALWGFDTGDLSDFLVRGLADSIHNPWTGMVATSTGQWFGQAAGTNWTSAPGILNPLTLYSFDPVTSELEQKGPLLAPEITGISIQGSLLAASNGKVYGSYYNGLFEYAPVADSLRLRAPMQCQNVSGGTQGCGPLGALTEICRKPNYKPRPTTNYNVCAGAHFFYDLRNVNANAVVWRRNGIAVASQTNQRLEFAAITEADEGVWTCTLTNECGVTEPPAITITVNAGAFTTSTISGDTLLCGTGDTALLASNTGGTWNTGVTTPTLDVTQPGFYHVSNTQACGLSMSNWVQVVQLDSAEAPFQLASLNLPGEYSICPGGDPFVFDLNSPGPWGNLPTGTWHDGSTGPTYTATDTGFVYVTATNACNSDTSGIYHLVRLPLTPLPPLTLTDNFGAADSYLCGEDSVVLSAPNTPEYGHYYPVFLNGQFQGQISGGQFFAQSLTLHEPGLYQVLSLDPCGGPADTMSFIVYRDTLPPQTAPAIVPDLSTLVGCVLDTAYLSTLDQPAYWSWTDGNGQSYQDTTAIVLVDWSAFAYTLTAFNGCGEGPQDFIFIQGTPAPDVQYTDALDTLCLTANAFALTAGTPTGGTYSGPGVNANTFSPATAGLGQHTITYSYSDGNCTGFAQAVLVVDVCTGVAEMHDAAGITVSPNPNDGAFQVYIERIFKVGTLTLFDARGKRVGNTTRLAPGSNAITQTDLAPGVYQVRLEIDGKVEQRSVVITRE